MISGKTRSALRFGRAIGALILIFTPLFVSAQAGPAMRGPLTIHLFGNYTYGSSAWSNNDSYGPTLGGFIQGRHLFGGEARGSYLHWGTQERRYDAMFGPRIAFHFSRFSPYGDILAGAGHGITYIRGINSSFKSGTGLEWKLVGGVDFYAGHHVSLRLGELSYARLDVFKNGLSAVDVSGGVVYRVPAREH